MLDDNLFYGHDFNQLPKRADARTECASVFAYHVQNPERYGVVEYSDDGKAISLEEKPATPRSNYAVTGLYFYDEKVAKKARTLKPSPRGELEITDLNRMYMDIGKLNVHIMGCRYAWLVSGTPESLLEAGQFIASIEQRQRLKVACPEENAYLNGWINAGQLEELAAPLRKNSQGQYLVCVFNEKVF